MMKRIDEIFFVLFMIAVVVLLLTRASPLRDAKIPAGRLMLSSPIAATLTGPAYLTSNLPVHRTGDDTIPSTSVGAGDATSTGASAI